MLLLSNSLTIFSSIREVAKVGEQLNFEACMDMMDLLYEKEDTSLLYQSSKSLAASILVNLFALHYPLFFFLNCSPLPSV